jgi:DNA-binding LacI/PurR family transcriptional regulator
MTVAHVDQSPRARTVRQLRQWLASGQVPPGDRLPTEQAMAQQLQVSRGTVRAALQLLEQDGLVQGRTVIAASAAPAAAAAPSSMMANTIVLLSAHVQVADRFRGSGFTAAVEIGAMDQLHAAGRLVLALPPDGCDDATVDELILQRPRGVVVPMRASAGDTVAGQLERLRSAGVPAVVNSDEPHYATFDRVEHDHAAGMGLLVRWLLAHGRLRPAFFCMPEPRLQWVQRRCAGYDDAMRDARLTPQPPIWLSGRLDTSGLSPADAFAARSRHFAGALADRLRGADAPDALLVASDGECYATAAALRLLGLEPNRDVWLVGYDAYWRSCSDEQSREAAHPLATIDKDNQRIGRDLVELLEARCAGRLPAAAQRVMVPPQLIIIPGGDAG